MSRFDKSIVQIDELSLISNFATLYFHFNYTFIIMCRQLIIPDFVLVPVLSQSLQLSADYHGNFLAELVPVHNRIFR